MSDVTPLLNLPYLEAADPPAIHTITQAISEAVEGNLIIGAAKRTSTQSISNSSTTKVSMTTEVLDTDTMIDIAANNTRITVKTAGFYLVQANMIFATTTSVSPPNLLRNNTAEAFGTATAVSLVSSTALTITYMTAAAVNDYFEVSVTQASGGAVALTVAGFTLTRLCPT